MLLTTLLLACAPQAPQSYAFAEKAHLPSDVSAPTSLDLLTDDLTGDSAPDLVFGDRTGLRLFVNDTHGVFADAAARLGSFRPPGPGALAAADIDGDGDTDLIVTDHTGRVRVARNDNGTFVEIPNAGPPGFMVSGLAPHDFDGDGDVDLLLQQSNGTFVLLNDGAGSFSQIRTVVNQFSTQDTLAADFDADGDIDLLLARAFGIGPVRSQLWRNDGAANFTEDPGALPALEIWRAVATDVDGDADLDVIAFEQLPAGTPDRFEVLVNDGTGSFTRSGSRGLGAPRTGDEPAVADLDGDGVDELVVADFERTVVYDRDAGGTWRAWRDSTLPENGSGLRRIAFADFDGDRDTDVFGADTARIYLLLNVDRGRFAPGVTRGLPSNGPLGMAVQAVDLDRDGFPEIVSSGPSTNGPELFRFDRDADRYTLDPVFESLGASARDVLAEDLTGDGAPDVYLAMNSFGGSAVGDRLFTNQRGRLFDATQTWLPADIGVTSAVRAADLDGDGRTDLVLRGGSLRILLGRTSSFVDGGSAPALGGSLTALLDLADVDLDGDVDVLLSDALLVNDGSANFTDATALLPASYSGARVASFADFDGDGDEDLYVGRPQITGRPQQDLLYENRGGQLVDVTLGGLPIALRDTGSVQVVDFDSDGDLDVVLDGPVFLRNDSGTVLRFTQVPPNLPDAGFGSQPVVALGDLDLDGDVDFGVRSRIAVDLRTQLVARYLPRLGADWPVELHAANAPPGSTTAALWLGTLERRLTVPGIAGVLMLDPRTAIDVATVTIPGPGTAARITIPVPANVTLLGVDFIAQALFVEAGQARFGNRVRAEIQ